MGDRRLPPNVNKMAKTGDADGLKLWAGEHYPALVLPAGADATALIGAIQDHKQALPDNPLFVEKADGADENIPPPVAIPPQINTRMNPPALDSQPPAQPPPQAPPGAPLQGAPAQALPPGLVGMELKSAGAPPPAAIERTDAVPSPQFQQAAGTPPQGAVVHPPPSPSPLEAVPQGAAPLPQAKSPDKPLEPYTAAGHVPTNPLTTTRYYSPEGIPLRPDTHPVLSAQELGQADFSYNERGGEFIPDLFREQGRVGPATPHGPQKHIVFRHPGGTRFLLNRNTGKAFRPTEMLMGRDDLIPHMGEQMPEGYTFGG